MRIHPNRSQFGQEPAAPLLKSLHLIASRQHENLALAPDAPDGVQREFGQALDDSQLVPEGGCSIEGPNRRVGLSSLSCSQSSAATSPGSRCRAPGNRFRATRAHLKTAESDTGSGRGGAVPPPCETRGIGGSDSHTPRSHLGRGSRGPPIPKQRQFSSQHRGWIVEDLSRSQGDVDGRHRRRALGRPGIGHSSQPGSRGRRSAGSLRLPGAPRGTGRDRSRRLSTSTSSLRLRSTGLVVASVISEFDLRDRGGARLGPGVIGHRSAGVTPVLMSKQTTLPSQNKREKSR